MSAESNRLEALLLQFDQWAAQQLNRPDGWPCSFPAIQELVDVAQRVAMNPLTAVLGSPSLDLVARVVSLTEEDERAIDTIAQRSGWVHVFTLLAATGDWQCRWQAYEYCKVCGRQAIPLLIAGLKDMHPYVVRRALLSLGSIDLETAQEQAVELEHHEDEGLARIAKQVQGGKLES